MSITLTKVRLPKRRKDILRRVRLIDALHQNIHRKLTLISAPAGYGKSSLLFDFAEDIDAAVDASVCWYSILPEDIALLPFVEHIIVAFQQRFPDFGTQLLDALQQPGSEPDALSLAGEVINEMVLHIDDFCVFMLDDYHLAGETAPIVILVEALLRDLPDQVRFIIAGRAEFGIPTAALYVRDDLSVINAGDLRFRADEIQQLVRQNYRVKLADEQADELATRADGWIVAILMAVHTLQHGALPSFSGAREQLYEFLAAEVVAQQPDDVREILFATSILDAFGADLCNAVLETGDSEVRLRDLEARNLFIVRIEDSAASTYRYHQLFAEFLQKRLVESDPALKLRLHACAANWYAEHTEWERAVKHALEAGELQVATEWLDAIARDFFVRGRTNTLLRWYDQLEANADLPRTAPNFVVNIAKVHTDAGDIAESISLLDLLEPHLNDISDPKLTVVALFARNMNHREQDEYEAALAAIQAARRLINESDLSKLSEANRHEGYCLARLGQTEEAISYLGAAAAGFRELDQSHDLAETLNDLSLVYYQNGHLFDAQRCVSEVLKLRQKDKNKGARALALNNYAFMQAQIGRYAEAWETYAEAIKCAREANRPHAIAVVLNGQGDLLTNIRDLERAHEAYEAAYNIGKRSSILFTLPYSCKGLSEVERLRGNYDLSMHWLREGVQIEESSMDATENQVRLGTIYLSMGQPELAVTALGGALNNSDGEVLHGKEKILAYFSLAQALLADGQREAALRELETSLTETAILGNDHYLAIAARGADHLMQYAREQWPENDHLLSLLKRSEGIPTKMESILEPKEEHISAQQSLEVYAFGPGQIRLNGEIIANRYWASKKARGIMFYLIDKGRARKDELSLEFWPEASHSASNSRVHVTIWRARKALSDHEIITHKDGLYSIAENIDTWYDVAEFERLLQHAQQSNASDIAIRKSLQEAIELYSGELLTGTSLDWVDMRRNELQLKYIQALIQLGEIELISSRYHDARLLYERAIEIDNFQDGAHVGLMKALVGLGLSSLAEAHYVKYAELLKTELNTNPTEELIVLYNKVHQP